MKLDNNRIGALITFIISLIVYTITTSPAVPFWDCGEFIASSVTMGVPHPPGAPVYLLAGKVFSFLPISPDMAHRFNILAGIVSALTIMFLYMIIVRLIKEFVKDDNSLESKLKIYFAAGIGALTYAFTDTFWFNATEAEVYSISMLGVSMVMWLTLIWMDNYKEIKSLKYLILISYLLGLSIGVHLLSFLVVPTIVILIYFHDRDMFMNLVVWGAVLGIFYMLAKSIGLNFVTLVIMFGCVWVVYYFDKKGYIHFKLWGFVLALVVLGLSTYLSIYIRSNLGPVINENDPSNLERFISYWNRDQYGSESLISTVFDRAAPFWTYQIKKMYIRYFAWNFIGKGTTLGADRYIVETFSPRGLYYLPFLLGSFGVFYHFKKDWKRAIAVMAMFIIMGLALVIYLNQPDPQPRERDYVYVGNFFAFAIWIGIAVTGLFDYAGKMIKNMPGMKNLVFGGLAGVVFIMGPFIEYKHNFHSHDRRGAYMPYDYSYNLLQSCEPNSMLFTNGDNDTFPLWYLQEVEGVRKDISIINLSLLNTPWYIKQLKQMDNPVPISFSDDRIDQLIGAIQWTEQTIKLPVPAEVYNEMIKEVHSSVNLEPIDAPVSIDFTVKPTYMQNYLRIQDLMIVNILFANNWKRPVYFAMTIPTENKLGLDRNLSLRGLASKVVPYPGAHLNADVLKENMLTKFQYRRLNDPDVFQDRQCVDLYQNIRFSFYQAADFYSRKSANFRTDSLEYSNELKQNALEILDFMMEVVPDEVVPFQNHLLLARIGQIYSENGRPEILEQVLESLVDRPGVHKTTQIEIAKLYSLNLKNDAKAIEICKRVIEENPGDVNGFSILITLLEQSRNWKEGIEWIDKWLAINPNDNNAKLIKNRFTQRLAQTDTTKNK